MNTTSITPAVREDELGLRIGNGRTLLAVADYAEASRVYSEMRDGSGLGASKLPRARLYRSGRKVAEVSYNGRVWEGDECVFDPFGRDGRCPWEQAP